MYGPHIFHTDSAEVVEYLSRFAEWLPYKHRVRAILPGGEDAPMPINRDTLKAHYGVELGSKGAMRQFLAEVRADIPEPENAEQYLQGIYGEELTELFFGGYTRKMWGLELSDMPMSVVARLPVRYGDEAGYFNDTFQQMPRDGYTELIAKMLQHEAIEARLSTAFDKSMESAYEHVFNSMPIDEYFDNEFGPLPYRSIRFDHRFDEDFPYDVPTMNFTDLGKYTRKTCWALYPGCGGEPGKHVTYEEPCSYEDNDFERYYPIKTVDGWPQERYRQYVELAKSKPNMTFIGRCGQYIYYDMHQVVANSRTIARQYLEATGTDG
jgi:UDP-galactopyranose mutase